jgi:monofunctional biosynthetic peptidoglycan transglycosylase
MQRWVSLRQIPQVAIDAVIVAEDGTFWSHGGFDWFEFRESLLRNIREFRFARGASTITQQLVKNLYLSSSKDPLRKAKEWILTWKMERTLSKARIVELYLNVIEWGNGVYGIEAAARYYFQKSVTELTREESARLAAIIPNPKRYRVDSQYVLRRTRLILSRMEARGV